MNHTWVKGKGVKTCVNCGVYAMLEHPTHVANPIALWTAFYSPDGRWIGFNRPDCLGEVSHSPPKEE